MIFEVTVLMQSGRQLGGRVDVASEAELVVMLAARSGETRVGRWVVPMAFVQDVHYRPVTFQDGPPG